MCVHACLFICIPYTCRSPLRPEKGLGSPRPALSPTLSLLPCLDLHPNNHTDCVAEPECIGVPRHALRAQNLRHPVPSRAECAEAEAQPQGDLHGGGPTQKRKHRGRQVARSSVGATGCSLPFLCFSWLHGMKLRRLHGDHRRPGMCKDHVCPARVNMPSERAKP